MVYTERDKLNIIRLDKEADDVSFEEIGGILEHNPTNAIYVEVGNELYGMITMGDVARASEAGDRTVSINCKFTKLKPNEYMKALQLFKERENFNALPIVDGTYLLGEFTRWNDLLILSKGLSAIYDNQWVKDYLKDKKIAFVKTGNKIKIGIMSNIVDELSEICLEVRLIDRMEITEYYEKMDYILFIDEDELRGTKTLLEKIYGEDEKHNLKTFCCWESTELRSEKEITHRMLRYIQDSGLYVLSIIFDDFTEERGFKKFKEDIKHRNIELALTEKEMKEKIHSEDFFEAFWKDFFADMYKEEYAKQIVFSEIKAKKSGELRDYKSKYINISNEERLTIGQPWLAERTIYFFGPCFVFGRYCEDRHTIESYLQSRINMAGYKVKVVNYGSWRNLLARIEMITNFQYKKGDIIVLYTADYVFSDIEQINLYEIYAKKGINVKWLTDNLLHINYKVNEIYADEIYGRLSKTLGEAGGQEKVFLDKDLIYKMYVDRYFSTCDLKKYINIGSIVMNCNPFTKGHRYLIEQALKRVDFLIIFVVEEDKSLFPFDIRMTCVKEGVADIENVMVVPSGEFILSQKTFPEYFIKLVDEDIVRNVEYDITIFAEKIAPLLNIKYRFVGEEPDDLVTREYNEAMKRILPKNGIELVEIPRKEFDGRVISATTVRKCLESRDMELLDTLVPESTKRVLFWTT